MHAAQHASVVCVRTVNVMAAVEDDLRWLHPGSAAVKPIRLQSYDGQH